MTYETFKLSANRYQDFMEHGTWYSCKFFTHKDCPISIISGAYGLLPRTHKVIVDIPLEITDENIKLVKSFGGVLKHNDNDYLRDGFGFPKFYCENYFQSNSYLVDVILKVIKKPRKKDPLKLAYEFVDANFDEIKSKFLVSDYNKFYEDEAKEM